jgi:serine/threonine protein kinase
MSTAPFKRDKTAREHQPISKFYTIGDLLGKGAFSQVKIATENETGNKFAVKIITKQGDDEDAERRSEIIQTEIAILKVVDHKNIVRLHEIFQDATTYYLVMEVISGGELFERIVALTSYSEKDASIVCKQVLEGIQHMHEKNIVHRDLKPENLLLQSEEANSDVKVTDFGLSHIQPHGEELKISKAVGTPSYLAPEVLDMLDNSVPYGKEVDLWAVGVILYILLCGFPPFYGETDDDIYDQIQEADFTFPSPAWDAISPGAIDLIEKLLTRNPKNRITALAALQHPWILGHSTPEKHLSNTLTELKKFNAKRKLKGAIKAVQALNRMKGVANSLIAASKAKK